jgi:membrane protein DedA with SNARE-associated domain
MPLPDPIAALSQLVDGLPRLGEALSRLPGALAQLVEALPRGLEAAAGSDPRLGYLVLGLAMLLENLIPPIPSELIQPLGGFLVQQGKLELLPVILVGVGGSVLGCWFWYGLGRWIGEARLIAWIGRHGSRLGIGVEDLVRSRAWFSRYGVGLVFWGRLVPGLRTWISVPAGLEAMPQGRFLLATGAGSAIWVTALTFAGRGLGAGYGQLGRLLAPYGQAAKLLLLALALVAAGFLLGRARRRVKPAD